MNGTLYGMALVDVMNRMRDTMDGAFTKGITAEPDGRTAPTTPARPTGAPPARGTILARALRLAARPAA